MTGNPYLMVALDGSNGEAFYQSGHGTRTLTFAYLINAGQNRQDVGLAHPQILANGGSVKDVACRAVSAAIPYGGAAGSVQAKKSINIDTIAPRLVDESNRFYQGWFGFNINERVTSTPKQMARPADICTRVTLFYTNGGSTSYEKIVPFSAWRADNRTTYITYNFPEVNEYRANVNGQYVYSGLKVEVIEYPPMYDKAGNQAVVPFGPFELQFIGGVTYWEL